MNERDMWHAFQCPGHTGTGLVFDVRVPETVLLETAKCPVCGRECRLRARWEATDRGYGGLGELTAAGEVELLERERDEARAEAARQRDRAALQERAHINCLGASVDWKARARAERDEARAEAARLVVLMQFEKARAKKAESALLDVHEALYAECDGSADLAAEVRALRARAEKAEAELAEARKTCPLLGDRLGSPGIIERAAAVRCLCVEFGPVKSKDLT